MRNRGQVKPKYAIDPFDLMVYENTQLMEENAKLRELGGEVASILFNLDVDRCGLCKRDDISRPCPVHTAKGGECPIKSELRELGIEVKS